MLRLRIAVEQDRADGIVDALNATGGVSRLVRIPAEGQREVIVLEGDVAPSVADQALDLITRLGIPAEDYVLARQDVVAPNPVHRGTFGAGGGVAWVEVMGEARANSRPLARYLALIGVAGVIAALGVVRSNSILIVGAMAVSPDLLPICATCVGLVGRRPALARRALLTLVVGLTLVVIVAAAVAALLDLTGAIGADFEIGQGGLHGLADVDYATILIALAAGIAAMLSFETRASTAVGVAISVTTIPASAYAGVALGVSEAGKAGGALLVLVANVTLLVVSGSLTLVAQRWAAGYREPEEAEEIETNGR